MEKGIEQNHITKENPLGTEPIGKLIRRYAVPSIISMMVSSLYNIVDQLFIGNSVGMLGNAATNVAFPLTIMCTSVALLCGIGGATNFNLNLGRGDREKAGKSIGSAIGMLIIFGLLILVSVRIFLNPMLHAFGATDEILSYALTYTGITSWGLPFLIFSAGGSNFVRADGSPKYSMACNLVGTIVNIILDAVFIVGLNMGMAGAAYATVIGQFCSAIMVVLYLLRFKTVKLQFSFMIPSVEHWKNVLALGVAPFFNQLAMFVVQISMNNTLTYYGALSSYGSEIPLACVGIISKVNMLYFALVLGISTGIQPIISFNYGAQKYLRVKSTYFKAVYAALALSVTAFLCFQLFPRQIIGIFGSGSEAYFSFAEKYFHIFLFFTFVNGMQPITANFFTAIGKPYKGVFLSLTRQIIFLLPLLFILPMIMGIDGVMFSAPIADFFAALLAILFIRKEMKVLGRLEDARVSEG